MGAGYKGYGAPAGIGFGGGGGKGYGGAGGKMNVSTPQFQNNTPQFQNNKGCGKGFGTNKLSFPIDDSNRDCVVWIGNIPKEISMDDLKQNFGGAGTIKHCGFLKNKQALVVYSSQQERDSAISMFN